MTDSVMLYEERVYFNRISLQGGKMRPTRAGFPPESSPESVRSRPIGTLWLSKPGLKNNRGKSLISLSPRQGETVKGKVPEKESGEISDFPLINYHTKMASLLVLARDYLRTTLVPRIAS